MVEAIAPPPDLTVSGWADRYRILTSESSAEPGHWRTDRAPYQREPMDSLNDPKVERVVIMSCSQVGKSEIINNILAYFIDYEPCPIMLSLPTLEMAEDYSKDRLDPLFSKTKRLLEKVGDRKSKKSDSTILRKKFPGGQLSLVGSNSPASLSSRPIRLYLGDEIDRYPVSAGEEGDPVDLGIARTRNFWNRKIVLVSTPNTQGESRIETAYEDSTQETWQMPCPSCTKFQQLKHAHMQHLLDEKGVLFKVEAACEFCGSLHSEAQWKKQQGRWVAKQFHRNTRGFHLNQYVSPWVSWLEIETQFLKVKDDTDRLKVFVNTVLGETWEEKGEVAAFESLFARREVYKAQVPMPVSVLTCGVDVQDNRLELEVVGWNGNQNWNIDYLVLHGDPAKDDLWNQLDKILRSTYVHESGNKFNIVATCIDSGGHHTQRVYDFCLARKSRRIYAIKGRGGAGVPLVSSPSKKKSGKDPRKFELFIVGSDEAKLQILRNMQVTDPALPGFCHFPMERDQEYFQQLTSEQLVRRFKNGVAYHAWHKKRARNEAFDCRMYARVALAILNPIWQNYSADDHPVQRSTPQHNPKPRQQKGTNSWL